MLRTELITLVNAIIDGNFASAERSLERLETVYNMSKTTAL